MSNMHADPPQPRDPEADVEANAEAGEPISPATASDEDAPDEQEDQPLSVEDLVNELETVTAQRDEYLALAQSKQAEFENYRKRIAKQLADDTNRAAAQLVEQLLPVLDAFDYGLAHGEDGLAPMQGQLWNVLDKEGLAKVAPQSDEPFDPHEHDAVEHEPADGEGHVVAETLRTGYRWRGRLLRPAMVRVRG